MKSVEWVFIRVQVFHSFFKGFQIRMNLVTLAAEPKYGTATAYPVMVRPAMAPAKKERGDARIILQISSESWQSCH